MFSFKQDAVLFDAQGNQTPNPDAPLRPDGSTAVPLSVRKEALKIVFFRHNDIDMSYVDTLIPPYVGGISSEKALMVSELGKQRSRFQNRFLKDMGKICMRLSEGDDFLGLFDQQLVAERRPFWTKVSAPACYYYFD